MDNQYPRENPKKSHGVAEVTGHGALLCAGATLCFLAALCLCASSAAAPMGSAPPATNNFITQPISPADAANPDFRRAQKDLASAEGIVAQTRDIAVPKVAATGSYSAVENTDVDIFSEP